MANTELLTSFKNLVASVGGIDLKGATVPYTSVNGNISSYLSKDGFLALRLPPQIRAAFIEKYKTTLVTAYGIVQKEYVVVPGSLLHQTDELKTYFEAIFAYVSELKPKITKRKKA
jgi:hypothetical protein